MLLYHNPESSALFFIYSSAIYIDLKLVLAYTVESCPHSHRHTFATTCIEMGVDVKSLSEFLGHANASVTLNTYVHSSLDRGASSIWAFWKKIVLGLAALRAWSCPTRRNGLYAWKIKVRGRRPAGGYLDLRGDTVPLCFVLFKTGSFSKSIWGAH